MYPIPPSETLIQTKTCRHCQALFPITDKDLEFYEKVSPVFKTPPSLPLSGEGHILPPDKGDWGGYRYLIPPPTLCPDCRQQRRLSFRNERKLYKRNCDATGKSIISIYSPDKPFKVYHQDFWWSDKWDPMEYGRDFDFNKSFFEQFGELMGEVPIQNLIVVSSENTEYGNYVIGVSSCYMAFVVSQSEWCIYGRNIRRCRDCVDCLQLVDSESCYNVVVWNKNYKVMNSYHVFGCSDCSYLWHCENCQHCFGCTNLYNKQYCFFNKQLTEEEYKTKFGKLTPSDIKKYEGLFWEFINKSVHKANNMMNNEWDCSYDFIRDSKNIVSSFNIYNSFDLKYCMELENSSECMDSDVWVWVGNTNLYECQAIARNNNKDLFGNTLADVSNLIYCNNCFNGCSHLFWCIGLRNKQYCILNKQYTKDEYEALVPKIIEHMMKSPLTPLSKGGSDEGAGGFEWWEFFPSSLSPFGYNETVAQEYYPLTREEVLSPLSSEGEGSGVRFNWSDYEAPFPKVEKIIPADKLPDDISKIPDDILNWAIECEVTKKPFRIIKQELEFYRKHNLSIPRRHPDQRHLDRMALRNPRKLFERKCDKCGVEMVTTYSPERKEVVYCEGCYEKEVIG